MEKRWWESKTVIGSLVTIGASVAGVAGVVVDADAQNQITELVVLTITSIGGLIALYGRIKAQSKITRK